MLGQPLSSSPDLRALIERARRHKMTPAEKFEQRVSFVFGQMWDSGLSKDDIRQRLAGGAA